MAKMIVVDHLKCTGCRICELVCSVKNTGVSNPARSRINVIKWESEGFFFPMVCQQCQSPACLAVCPKDAIAKDEKLGRVVVDYNLCIGCQLCVTACPFGCMSIDTVENTVIKCELCDGEPECVKFCDPKAIDYIEADVVTLKKKRAAVEKFSELMKKLV